MTFILNVLHKDFSVLAADTKAHTIGPATLTTHGLTIQLPANSTIDGFVKIHLGESGLLALGIAGNVQDHHYMAEIEQSKSPADALSITRRHMESFLRVDNLAEIVATETFTENQGIATFFDQASGLYCSNIYAFSPIHNYTRLYVPKPEGATLIHGGSGSVFFNEAVGLDKIEAFASSMKAISDIPACLDWLSHAYENVSRLDEGTGKHFEVFVSTRLSPRFAHGAHG